MLKISNYSEQINALHAEGKTAFEIFKILNFKYYQPIHNYFKKNGWDFVERKDYAYSTKYQVNESFFKKIDTEEKAYILGFICADGHIDTTNGRIRIALMDSDYLELEKIRKAMSSTHPILRGLMKGNPYKKSKKQILYQCSISINSVKLVQSLTKIGLTSNKTYLLDSIIIKAVPKKLIKHFLRGYFDGDGNVTWNKHYNSGNKFIVQVCGNKDFLIGTFQKYFPSLCKLYKDKYSKQCYTWKIANKKEVMKFLTYLYGDAHIYLDRKYNIYKEAMWSCKTELIAGNSDFIEMMEGQSAANPLIKCLRQVQRLADETFPNVNEKRGEEYNSATNAQHLESQSNLSEDIV